MPNELSLPQQTAQDLENKITTGLLSGDLPSISKLAESLGISPVSTRLALHILEDKGLIEIKQGKGTKVVGTTPTDPISIESPFSSQDIAAMSFRAESLKKDQLYAIGLHLFTQRRIAEVAYEENPDQNTLQRFMATAGRETVFAQLLMEPKVGEGLSGAGIRRMFASEIRDLENAPTIGDALVAIGSESKKF